MLCFCHCHRTQSRSDDVPYSTGNFAKYATVLADVERVASAWVSLVSSCCAGACRRLTPADLYFYIRQLPTAEFVEPLGLGVWVVCVVWSRLLEEEKNFFDV